MSPTNSESGGPQTDDGPDVDGDGVGARAGAGARAGEVAGAPGAADSRPRQRQRIVKVAGARRARLTPAPGTSPEPVTADAASDPDSPTTGPSGPNDAQLRRDVPPHY